MAAAADGIEAAKIFRSEKIVFDLPDATVEYTSGFLDMEESRAMFNELRENIVWHQPEVKLFGKTVLSPRLSAWYGDEGASYTYSGLLNTPLPWTPALSGLRVRLQAYLGVSFNSVLLNLYRNGQDSMGWHSDNEKELGSKPAIASLSLGAERIFIFKHKKRKDLASQKISLKNGSLLFMADNTQIYWKHSVPKTSKPVDERISLTFRKIV